MRARAGEKRRGARGSRLIKKGRKEEEKEEDKKKHTREGREKEKKLALNIQTQQTRYNGGC